MLQMQIPSMLTYIQKNKFQKINNKKQFKKNIILYMNKISMLS